MELYLLNGDVCANKWLRMSIPQLLRLILSCMTPKFIPLKNEYKTKKTA